MKIILEFSLTMPNCVYRQRETTNQKNKMQQTQIAKLHEVFDRLPCDITIVLSIALAEKLGVTPEDIIREYEAWQIA
jgi:hypothetical protein